MLSWFEYSREGSAQQIHSSGPILEPSLAYPMILSP
jgi:hypothetical protein